MAELEKPRLGPTGYCICPKCGFRKGHYPNVPCQAEKCPKCGAKLLREEGEHYKKILEKRNK
jgi:ribosomal protein L40E